jgi:hypothetical protein
VIPEPAPHRNPRQAQESGIIGRDFKSGCRIKFGFLNPAIAGIT